MSERANDTNRSRLLALLDANSKIPAKFVEELMASDDREDQAEAFYCLSERWGQIQPEREAWATAPFMLGFLIRSITEPSERAHTDSNVLSHYEAAHALVAILRNLSDHPRRERAAARTGRADHPDVFGGERIGARLHRNGLPGTCARAPRPAALVRVVEEPFHQTAPTRSTPARLRGKNESGHCHSPARNARR